MHMTIQIEMISGWLGSTSGRTQVVLVHGVFLFDVLVASAPSRRHPTLAGGKSGQVEGATAPRTHVVAVKFVVAQVRRFESNRALGAMEQNTTPSPRGIHCNYLASLAIQVKSFEAMRADERVRQDV